MITRQEIGEAIAKEMTINEIDGYWYGRHETLISKVTVQNTTGDAIVDLGKEIARVGSKFTPLYGDHGEVIGSTTDYKYRQALKDYIRREQDRLIEEDEDRMADEEARFGGDFNPGDWYQDDPDFASDSMDHDLYEEGN